MSAGVPVHDFRGVDPSREQLEEAEGLRAADERARLQAAAEAHRSLYRSDAPCPRARLSTGATIPLIGLGTWKSEKGAVAAAVVEAVRAGYRHIDCAAVYGNEEEVGQALAQIFSEGVVRRSDLFITSKLWNSEHGRERARAACLKTLKDLRLDYLDLYLIHWPHSGRAGPSVAPPLAETWAELEAIASDGLACAVGVSNFSIKKMEALAEAGARLVPAVLQVEAHPYWRNDALIAWAASRGIHVTAYSPLGSPDSAAIMRRGPDVPSLMDDPTVAAAAGRLGASPAQVLIRWAVQRGTSVLPKSVNPARIRANLEAAALELPAADFGALSSLPKQMRMLPGDFLVDPQNGPYKSRAELWDEPEPAAAAL